MKVGANRPGASPQPCAMRRRRWLLPSLPLPFDSGSKTAALLASWRPPGLCWPAPRPFGPLPRPPAGDQGAFYPGAFFLWAPARAMFLSCLARRSGRRPALYAGAAVLGDAMLPLRPPVTNH
ncbi:unnamed protein product [Amoebophrya sp. A120]|nr:unnamed protein product [Amoebophrya sp. A120]|eukprot:GSA120T00019287001.1